MKYINSQSGLEELCRQVESSPFAAVDTEGDSLHHYVEKLCLVQVSVPGEDFIVDPLVHLDLLPLNQALEKKLLIFHGADYDVRMLKKAASFTPAQIFDTMIAAQYLGYEKFGLADLTERICGIRLVKTGQKADWSIRPLPQNLLDYASKDTHYLEEVYGVMKKELSDLGRLSWHRQACDKLLKSLNEPRIFEKDSSLDWQIKGSKELSPRALTTLRELWHWREEEARRVDRPSFKMLNAEYLTELARWAETHPGADIAEWEKCPRHLKRDFREPLNALLARSAAMPPTPYQTAPKSGKGGRRLNGSEEDKFGRLREEKIKIGAELKVNPSILATNSILEEIVRKLPQTPQDLAAIEGILPWQAELLCPVFLPLLSPQKNPTLF